MIKSFILAIQFLTSITISKNLKCDEKELASSTKFFPIVGFLIGLILLIFYLILHQIFPNDIIAILLIIILVSISGMQLDGFADTFDGIFGGKNKEERLKIMKDSNIGTFGAVSLICLILLKFLLIYEILKFENLKFIIFSLLLFPTVSKLNVVMAMKFFPYVRMNGGKTKFSQYVSYKEVTIATLFTLILFFLIIALFSNFYFLLFLPILFIFIYIFSTYISKKIGGLTGDCYGALNEISEILFLIFCFVYLKFF